jgi:hypothetical protein
MNAVYKYELAIGVVNLVSMPEGAEVLSVQEQQENVVLYALVSAETTRLRVRKFLVAMTGQVIDEGLSREQFIGTAMLQGGQFVVHVFEIK